MYASRKQRCNLQTCNPSWNLKPFKVWHRLWLILTGFHVLNRVDIESSKSTNVALLFLFYEVFLKWVTTQWAVGFVIQSVNLSKPPNFWYSKVRRWGWGILKHPLYSGLVFTIAHKCNLITSSSSRLNDWKYV